ncbi:hypothetical protein BH09BAC6_BH09BAC6_01450 [soil metagenome]|jgi:hypothetical protein
MRKIAGLLLFILSLAALLLAMNQTFINRLKKDRYFDHLNPPTAYNNSLYYRFFVRSDRWRYGDLYGLCYLPAYRFKLEPFKSYNKNTTRPVSNKILYVIGDSYLADKVLSGAFDKFDDVIFLDRRFPFGPITLDSTKQNYLVMEFAERNLNDFDFSKTGEVKWSKTDILNKSNYNTAYSINRVNSGLPTTIPERVNKAIFNKELSRNIELLLFDDKIFTPLKQLKATINYRLFNRLAKEVAVSTDKKRLLMNITVDTSYRQSDFREVNARELDQLTGNLAIANKYYLSIGFKKVLLSVIPNAVSVYDEKRMHYNRLLERVEQNNRFPVISIFKNFKNTSQNLYYRSDTHWNPVGLDVWVNEVNKSSSTW